MRGKSCAVVMFGLVLAAMIAARAVERAAAGGAQWPNVVLDEPQWPNLRLDDIEAPRLNKRPSFVDPQERLIDVSNLFGTTLTKTQRDLFVQILHR